MRCDSMTPMTKGAWLVLVAASCGGPGSTVRLDETSAEGHRQEAARERAAATEARLHGQPSRGPLGPSMVSAPGASPSQGIRKDFRRW